MDAITVDHVNEANNKLKKATCDHIYQEKIENDYLLRVVIGAYRPVVFKCIKCGNEFEKNIGVV